MTVLIKTGTFSAATVTGNQAITGVGFQPKGIIFFATETTTEDTVNLAGGGGYGFTDGTNNFSVAGGVVNNVAPSSSCADRGTSTLSCILLTTGTSSTASAAKIVTLDVDGFTINWTTNNGTAYKINFIAFGGSTITNVLVGNWTTPSTTGNASVTGLGFKPDFVFTACGNSGTANTVSAGYTNSMGAFDAAGEQFTNLSDGGTISPYKARRYERTNELMSTAAFGTTPAITSEAAFVSMDSGGWTENWTTAIAAVTGYIAVKGIKIKIGSFNSLTTTGSQSITGVGFKPTGLILSSALSTSSTTLNTDCCFGYGMADSPTSRRTMSNDAVDNVTTTSSCKFVSETGIFSAVTAASTLNAKADLTSFDIDGFTLNWGTNDATRGAMEICYIALGPIPTSHNVFIEWEEA